MLLNLEKIKGDSEGGAVLPDLAFECFEENAAQYFAVLERDYKKLNPNEALNALSALSQFKEYFASSPDWERVTLHLLSTLRKGIYNSIFHKHAVFAGMPHVAFVIHSLSLKTPSIKPFLRGIHELLLGNLSSYLQGAQQEEFINAGNFEVIKGLSGPLRYLLCFEGDNQMGDMANKIVEAFIKRSQSKTISGHKVTGWHYYPSAIEKSFMTAQAANGCVNYGVAHGMGGPLITLSMAYRNGARVEGLEEGINGIISEYMKASYRINDVVYWPGRTTLEQYAGQEEIRHTPNQMSWCYGSTGILRALYLSAVSISNEGLEGFAVDELLKIAQMQTAEYLLASPIVCHGFAGTAAIFNLMYRDTGKAEFLGKAMELAEICARIDIEHYFENARRTANQRNTPSRATLHDYLEGYSGILQSLLSIINKHPNENEKRLLIF